jgi:trigger factor
MNDIQITTKRSDGAERLLEISVPPERIRKAEDKAASRYASQARLPGFRPGKAPPALIRKRFKDAIRAEALESLVQEAFQAAIEQQQLKVAAQPHVHDLKFDENGPLTFQLHVEVRPEVNLERLEGFRVARREATVEDEQVTQQLDALRDQRATYAPVEGKPLPDDMVTVELATEEEGGTFPEGKEYRIVLGGGQAIPGIEEVIMDMTPGETVERSVRWPDDFPDEAQRGTNKTVRVTLKDAKRKVLPALDDDFAREVGDFDSIDKLRDTVAGDLRDHARRDADAAVRSQLLDEIASASPFGVPQSWVTQLVDSYFQMYQIPAEERERFAAEFRPVAERQVRRDLIIEAIAEREGLKATEADIDDRVAEMAQKRDTDPGKLYASLQKAGRLKEMEHGITEEKVFAWLLERNTVE